LEFGVGKHVNIFNVVMFGVSKFGIAIPFLSVEPVFINSENKLCNKRYSKQTHMRKTNTFSRILGNYFSMLEFMI
jgi:hypothetical protein